MQKPKLTHVLHNGWFVLCWAQQILDILGNQAAMAEARYAVKQKAEAWASLTDLQSAGWIPA